MNIQSISLRRIASPLKQPFVNALGTITKREAIIVEVKDRDGLSGWGEVVAFSSPWYTEETITTCYYMLKDFLIPAIQQIQVSHPDQLETLFSFVRGNHMAKSGIECAFWDLYSKQLNIPLSKLFNGVKKTIDSGVVVASDNIEKAIQQIEEYKKDGYKKYKIKINPRTAIQYVSNICNEYPNIPLMVDANSSFTKVDLKTLQALDKFDLMMIEQPLGHDDLIEHGQLQKQLTTPICLDESIVSFTSVQNAIELNSCQVICVKMGRVGGWKQAKKIHDLCLNNGIPLWCGGMIEFGISRAHNIALASLEGFTLPSDISSSSRFWDEDIIDPEIVVENGTVKVSKSPGIGYNINYTVLDKLTVYQENFII